MFIVLLLVVNIHCVVNVHKCVVANVDHVVTNVHCVANAHHVCLLFQVRITIVVHCVVVDVHRVTFPCLCLILPYPCIVMQVGVSLKVEG
jgi:hypothetical protein